jgi:putative protease
MIARNEIELMAPAGSYEALMGAIQGGADSVYFGVEQLNMRSASSANFTLDDLARITATCREYGMKSYLTVNTVLYDSDLPTMRTVLDCAKREGVTAIIASDQAAIVYARSIGLPVHISTQLNVSNAETVAFYAPFAEVVVLARELNLKQIRAIYDQIAARDLRGSGGEPVKIELFAHGALCMAISGKCYLSLHETGHSANRGACRQICRRTYTVQDTETGAELEVENPHIMSPKDLCTIDFLDEVIGAGVRVLKIEGRARSAEYVKRVCTAYNEALDALADGSYTPQRVAEWKKQLAEVFNRGFWGGYYLGQRLGEWSRNYGSSATRRKVYVGKVIHYFPGPGVAEILVEAAPLHAGEELLLMGETTGVLEWKADTPWVDEQPAPCVRQGTKCSLKTPATVRRNDKLYKWVDASADPQ